MSNNIISDLSETARAFNRVNEIRNVVHALEDGICNESPIWLASDVAGLGRRFNVDVRGLGVLLEQADRGNADLDFAAAHATIRELSSAIAAEDDRQREAQPGDTPEQPANDWIPPADQARMLGLDSQRDQTRRLQITGNVRNKAASMGFPLDIDNRGNKGRWVRHAQWEPVSDLFRTILRRVPDADAAQKVFTDAGKVETGEASFYCVTDNRIWRSTEDHPVCPKCGKPAKQITPRKP